MRNAAPVLALVALVLSLSGCYHATVVTGATPGNQTLEKPWATSLIGGLVPPSEVDTAERCTQGVARVETKLSFLNMLVGGLTFGIYTPMHISVTCAAGEDSDALPVVETREEARRALAEGRSFVLRAP